jgi:hypothetical protein
VLHYSSDLHIGHRKTDCNKKRASMQEHSLLTVHLHIQLAVPSGYNLTTHNSNLRSEKKNIPFVSSEFAHAIEIYVSQSHAGFLCQDYYSVMGVITFCLKAACREIGTLQLKTLLNKDAVYATASIPGDISILSVSYHSGSAYLK